MVAASFEELAQRKEEVAGRFVLFNRDMDPAAGAGYGTVARHRVHGASKAGELGAVGVLVRSLGTAAFRLPHTGTLEYAEDAPTIPAVALAEEDADLIARLRASGDAVRLRLVLGCRSEPDAEESNVVGELRGRERPEEIVLIGAHLDSWDLGTGALDDGVGVAVVLEAMRLLRVLDLVPRRTVRAVLFANEENGLRGGREYALAHEAGLSLHVAALEADSGGGTLLGWGISAGEGGAERLRELAAPLAFIGGDAVREGGGGPDISPLRPAGVPLIGLRQDAGRYFDYHHSAADTLDKVNPDDLTTGAAALAFMAYALAEWRGTLPRLPAEAGATSP
jgi:Zn-dependent M28 family amino/carboxypeptidase